MALLGDFDDSYTSTGKGFLSRASMWLSLLPAPIGTTWSMAVGMVDTVWDAGQWLLRGKLGSAATVLAAGTVGTAVNAVVPVWWQVGSGVATSTSLGTHARALTESAIGGISGALGSKPQVLRSYPAGIGSISAGQMQSGPGKFASSVAAERGVNANELHARYMSGEGGVHVNELQSAYGRGAA